MGSKFLFAAAALLAASPAAAAVSVIGSTAAQSCYEAAGAKGVQGPDVIRMCDEALRQEGLSHEDRVATLVNRGILKARAGAIGEAIADYDAALSGDPDQAEAYLNKGFALLNLSEAGDQAKPMFDTALAKKTRRPELAYYGRAVAHELSGQVRAAYLDYRQASRIDPKWRQPKLDLARFRVN